MRKFLWILMGVFCITGGMVGANCLQVTFDNGDDICVEISKKGSIYTASIAKSNIASRSAIRCELLLPDKTLEDLGACNGSFSYSSKKTQDVKMYVRYNGTYYSVVSAGLDFSDGNWKDATNDDDEDDDKNEDVEITSTDTSVETEDWVDVTIKTDKNYRGKVTFSDIKYKSTSSSSWTTISSDNSKYFSDTSSAWEDEYVTMKSSDDGEKKISKLVKFKKEGIYKITVEDTDNNSDSIQFHVDDEDDDDDDSNDKLEISTSDRTVETKTRVDVTIETDDAYRGKVNFNKVEYRSSSSNSWSSISRSSSTYFDTTSTEWDDGYITMKSSDDGEKTISKLVKFKKEGDYKITVKDTDNNSDSIQFSVGDDNDDENDELDISTKDTTISKDEWMNIKILTDEDYEGKVNFTKVRYKSSNSASWSTLSSKTSSTYFSDYASEWSRGYVTMSDGEKKISKFLKFKKDGIYEITAEDNDDNKDTLKIYVGVSNDDDDEDDEEDFSVTFSPKNPKQGKYVDVKVTADSSYVGEIKISKVEYREDSDDDWTTVSSSTSSTYYSKYSQSWKDKKIQIYSSNDGEGEVEDFVAFKKEGTYSITFRDKDNKTTTVKVNVGETSDPDDEESDIKGFTERQLSVVRYFKDNWDDLVDELKRETPILRQKTEWIKMGDEIYKNLKAVLNDKSDREYEDYEDMTDAIMKWLKKAQSYS